MNVLMSTPISPGDQATCSFCDAPVARAVFKVQPPFLHEPSDVFSHWETIPHNCNKKPNPLVFKEPSKKKDNEDRQLSSNVDYKNPETQDFDGIKKSNVDFKDE